MKGINKCMISSEITKRILDDISNLRAETEPTVPDSNTLTYTSTNLPPWSVEHHPFTEKPDIPSEHKDQMTFDWTWDARTTDDFCYAVQRCNPSDPDLPHTVSSSLSAENSIYPSEYKKFYQDIAQGAKEWSDKPSDRKKIKDAIEYTLTQARNSTSPGTNLSSRLKRDEMFRIVSKFLEYID